MALSGQAEGRRTRISEAAIAGFRARHPELKRLTASEAAGQIIAWAAREHAAWFWKGVRSPEVRVFYLDP